MKDKEFELAELSKEIHDCSKCKLHVLRNKAVIGRGNCNAKYMLLGEAPGAEEDKQGLPFVGDCGKLLTDIVEKGMKLKREDVYITNLVKCRPSVNNGARNRSPEVDEIFLCGEYLRREIEIIKPLVIICFGSFVSRFLLDRHEGITKFRGRVYEYKGIPVVPTYHPSYIKNYAPAEAKAEMWYDIKLALAVVAGLDLSGIKV